MGVKWKPPECQLRVVEGLPGAGKSFFLVRKTADIILKQKRPVYTNLPIRFRVFRQWLRNRGGEQYANLIVELTDLHWFNFLKRNKDKQEFQQAYKSQCKIDGVKFVRRKFEKAWIDKAGPDITRPGEGLVPNWIPPLAVIIIDEVQHWHPMERNLKGNDAEGMKAYFTMMRHHLHDVWVATQIWGNVSKGLRDLARQFVQVKSLSERKILYGLRYKHLGLRGIGYNLYSIEQMQAQQSKGADEDDFGSMPLESELCFPSLPWYQYWFRLYDSFTHAESPRKMLEQLKRLQVEAGIDELEAHIEASKQSAKEDRVKKLMKLMMRGVWVVIFIIIGAVIAAAVVGNPPPPPAVTLASGSNQPPPAVSVDPLLRWWPEEGKVTGIGSRGVMTTSGDIQLGGKFGNGKLRIIDAQNRRTLWITGDDLWLWKLGSPEPERIAGKNELDRINRLSRALGSGAASPPIDPPRSDGGGVLESLEGDPDSR